MSDRSRKTKEMTGKRTRNDRGKSKETAGRDDPKAHTSRIGWNRSQFPRDNAESNGSFRTFGEEVQADHNIRDEKHLSSLFESPNNQGLSTTKSGRAPSKDGGKPEPPGQSLAPVNIEDLESSDPLPGEELSRLTLANPKRIHKIQHDDSEKGNNSTSNQGQSSDTSTTTSSSGHPKIRRVSEADSPHHHDEPQTSPQLDVSMLQERDSTSGEGGGGLCPETNPDPGSRSEASRGKDSGNSAGSRVNKSRARKGSTKNRPSEDSGSPGNHQEDSGVLLADIVGKGVPGARSKVPSHSESAQFTDGSRTPITTVVSSAKPPKPRSGRDKGKATQASYKAQDQMEGEEEGATCSSAESRHSRQGLKNHKSGDVVLDDLEDADESCSEEEKEPDPEEDSAMTEAEGEQKQAKASGSMENGEHSNHSNGTAGVKGYWGKAAGEMSKANHKISSFLRQIRKRGKRRSRETTVKEIHIVPEQDENQWALRSASSAASRQSASSATSTYSGHSSQDEGVPVVDDLEEPDLSMITH